MRNFFRRLFSFLGRAPVAPIARVPGDEAWGSFTRDEIDTAALRLVYGRIPDVFPSYLGGTLNQATSAQVVIDKLRKEYEGFEPRAMRVRIMKWLDYFEREIAEKRVDITTQKSKRQQDAYREEMNQKSARADAVIRSLDSFKHKG